MTFALNCVTGEFLCTVNLSVLSVIKITLIIGYQWDVESPSATAIQDNDLSSSINTNTNRQTFILTIMHCCWLHTDCSLACSSVGFAWKQGFGEICLGIVNGVGLGLGCVQTVAGDMLVGGGGGCGCWHDSISPPYPVFGTEIGRRKHTFLSLKYLLVNVQA